MIQDEVIRIAGILFSRYGIDAVSSEKVARVLGVPLQDVESYFDKENLLKESISSEVKRICVVIDKIEELANSPVEAVFNISTYVFRVLTSLSPAFYNDLKKYPKQENYFYSQKIRFRKICIGQFIEGEKEGFFISGDGYETFASIFIEEISKLDLKYQRGNILAFLHGVCTEKGLKELINI